jgi:hypothetical protein
MAPEVIKIADPFKKNSMLYKPTDLTDLVQLQFLCFCIKCQTFSKNLGRIKNLQTLVIESIEQYCLNKD